MKLLFLDKMEHVTFNSGTKMEIPHLEPFEYWFAQNGMIRLSYLGKMGLTWPGVYEYLNTNIGDRAALEAAGVKRHCEMEAGRRQGMGKGDEALY